VIVDEFFRSLVYELDFVIEANNLARIRANMREFPEIVIPQVHKNLSREKVLTLERIEGIRVNDLKAIDAAGINKRAIVEAGARAFFKMIIIDGIFHADLHGGNLFILPGNRIGMVDFGIVGRLSEQSREQLAGMMLSLITEDFENLCYLYAEVSVSGDAIDLEGFQREVRNMIAPYVGMSLKEVNTGRILMEATRIGARYNIQVPGEWMLVFKALITMEGMGRSLDPDFDLLANGQQLVNDLLKSQYSPERLRKELLWVGKDVARLVQMLPRQIRWMFKKLNSNDFAFEIKSPELREFVVQSEANTRRMSRSVVTAGLLVAGAIALHERVGPSVGPYPLAATLLLGAGGIVALRLLFR
jgi:ubiquinone biosynthesis protein